MPVTFQLTSGATVTIFVSKHAHIAVSQYQQSPQHKEEVLVMDGLHNNGGWKINEPYSQVVEKIGTALRLA